MAAGADAPYQRPYDPLHRTQEERQPLLPPLGFSSSSSNEDQGRPAEEQEEERKARESGPPRLPLLCAVAIVIVLVLAAAMLWLYLRPQAAAGGASLAQAVGVAATPQAAGVAATPHDTAALLQVYSERQQLAAAPLEVAALAARAAEEAAGRSTGTPAEKHRGGPATIAARERRRGPTAALLDAGVAGMSMP